MCCGCSPGKRQKKKKKTESVFHINTNTESSFKKVIINRVVLVKEGQESLTSSTFSFHDPRVPKAHKTTDLSLSLSLSLSHTHTHTHTHTHSPLLLSLSLSLSHTHIHTHLYLGTNET